MEKQTQKIDTVVCWIQIPVKSTTLQSLLFEHLGLDQERVEFFQLEQWHLEGVEI